MTVVPVLGGATALLAGWAASAPSVVAAGVACIVLGIGALATRAGLLGGRIARQLHEELRAKAHHDTETALDAFRQRLAQDKDTRDEEMLDSLRDLAQVFQRNTEWASRINVVSAAEISSGVEELVRTCIQKLEDAFKLLQTSRDLSVSPVRDAVLAQREEILSEVATSIRELTDLLTGVYTLGTGRDVGADTARVRERLKESLDLARRVEEVMDPKAAVRQRIQARAKGKPTATS